MSPILQTWNNFGKFERSSLVMTIIFFFGGILFFLIMINSSSPVLQHEVTKSEAVSYNVNLEKDHFYRFFLKTNTQGDIRVWCTLFDEDDSELISEYLSNFPGMSSAITTRRNDKNLSFLSSRSGIFRLDIRISSEADKPAWFILEETTVVLFGIPDDQISMLCFVGSVIMFLLFILALLKNRNKLNRG